MQHVMRKAGVVGATAVTMVTAVLTGVIAGSGTSTASDTASEASGADARRDQMLVVYDRFAPPRAFVHPRAVTYDQRRVPAAAGIQVGQRVGPERTTVRVAVHGIAPRHTFGVHVHTKPCGARPDDSGPHYQNVKDPHQPSTDPRFANPRNEVWLDLTTDAKGNGAAVSRHGWTFRPGEARSVVVHERGTHTGPGHAGQAGDRLACFSVPFIAPANGA